MASTRAATAKERAAKTGARKWAVISAEWERSGLRQAEFCRQRGVAVRTLRWWRWRLGREATPCDPGAARPVTSSPPPPAITPAFLPVQVIAEPRRRRRRPTPTIDIVLQRRRRVRVSADFDARLLARVVSVLEAIP